MSLEEEESFQQSKVCWLCEASFAEGLNPFGDTEGASHDKVRDHDHLTGKYRGAAHNKCNLNCKKKSSSLVPIFFHTFSGYDCHLIFEELLTPAYNLKLPKNIIPKSMENYVSVQVGCLRFLDSYRLLSSSLRKLAYPYEKINLNNIHEPLNLTQEDFWSTLTQSYPWDDDIKKLNN